MAGVTKKSIFIVLLPYCSRGLYPQNIVSMQVHSICRLYNDYYCLCYALVKIDCRFFIFDDLYRFFDVLI